MCGIAGYIGKNCAEKQLLESLKLLEYRGYDSAGIAVQDKNKINITKTTGKIIALENMLPNTKSICGIAHTRWATHGAPTYENTHPHLSNDSTWAVVHNGIIENYGTIKKDLISKGYNFKSETDTEVIANLLQQQNSNDIHALINTCNMLIGSYALACINKNIPNKIFLARKKSPLYVASEQGEVFIASDPVCFLSKASEYYTLADNQYCIASTRHLEFFNTSGQKINLQPTKTEKFDISYQKHNYKHYMEKEINQVPAVLNNLIETYNSADLLKKFDKNYLAKFNKIVLIGCGTAYHAGLMGARYIQEFARIDASCHIASEYRYCNPIIDNKTLCILVSQSGETADTLAVCELAKAHGATTVALTNVLYSTLARMADEILPVCAGTEIAVASTKAYTAQITVLYMFAKQLQNVIANKKENYYETVHKLAKKITIPSPKSLKKAVLEVLASEKVFFIGRDYDYVSVKEASLKLKEITYINTAEHPAGELKHGFLSLVDKNSVVFALATQQHLLNKTLNGAHEALARGAKVIMVSQFNIPKEQTQGFYHTVKLQKFSEELLPISCISFFQLLAYETSLAKGLNPDQPRNLAKSVTVE